MLAVGKLQIDLTSLADVFFLQKKLTLTFIPINLIGICILDPLQQKTRLEYR